MTGCMHLLQQTIKTLAQNAFFAQKRCAQQLLMVTDGVPNLGYNGLIFVDPRLKVDETYYCDLLLSQRLLPAPAQISGEFIFQQDNYCFSVQGMLVFRR